MSESEIALDIETAQATAIALLKLIKTYPWLLEVADSGYDPSVARDILIREAKRIKERR